MFKKTTWHDSEFGQRKFVLSSKETAAVLQSSGRLSLSKMKAPKQSLPYLWWTRCFDLSYWAACNKNQQEWARHGWISSRWSCKSQWRQVTDVEILGVYFLLLFLYAILGQGFWTRKAVVKRTTAVPLASKHPNNLISNLLHYMKDWCSVISKLGTEVAGINLARRHCFSQIIGEGLAIFSGRKKKVWRSNVFWGIQSTLSPKRVLFEPGSAEASERILQSFKENPWVRPSHFVRFGKSVSEKRFDIFMPQLFFSLLPFKASLWHAQTNKLEHLVWSDGLHRLAPCIAWLGPGSAFVWTFGGTHSDIRQDDSMLDDEDYMNKWAEAW